MGTTLEQGLQNKCITVMVMLEYMLSRNETIGLEEKKNYQHYRRQLKYKDRHH